MLAGATRHQRARRRVYVFHMFTSVPPARPGETILLVEDQPAVRHAIRKQLIRLGYAVVESGNGIAALEIAAIASHLDLVLTDLVLPQMRGTALAERLRVLRPRLPVILMTGYGDTIDGVSIPSGMNVIHKPLSMDSLAQAIRRAIDG